MTRKLTVRMAEFESVVLTGHVNIDTENDSQILERAGVDPYDPNQVNRFIRNILDGSLLADVEDAHVATLLTADDTFIHGYFEDLEERVGK